MDGKKRRPRIERAGPPAARGGGALVWAIDVLSDRWAILLLREAFRGRTRFSEFAQHLDAPKARIAERLRHLVQAGVFERTGSPAAGSRSNYVLTEAGIDSFQIAIALNAWGDKWRYPKGKPPLLYFHAARRHKLRPRLACGSCSGVLQPENISFARAGLTQANTRTLQAWRRAPQSYSKFAEPCSMDATLRAVGDRWSALLLVAYFVSDARRFEDFHSTLGIPRTTLTARLKHLTEEGILVAQPYQSGPERFDYILSPAGGDLFDYVVSLAGWAERALGCAPLVWHADCGRPAHPRFLCKVCGDVVDRRQIRGERGPALAAWIAARS